MEDISITKQWVCTHNGHSWILDTKSIQHGGEELTFVKLIKWKRDFVKFSTGKALSFSPGGSKEYCTISCVNEVVKARQIAANDALTRAMDTDEVDRRRVAGRKRTRPRTCKPSDLVLLDDVLLIALPGAHGGHFRCLAEGIGSKVCWLEVSRPVMQWILSFTSARLAESAQSADVEVPDGAHHGHAEAHQGHVEAHQGHDEAHQSDDS